MSQSSTVTSQDGPNQEWSSTSTIAPGSIGGAAWDGEIDSPRRIQFPAAETSRRETRGAWPGAAAISIGRRL
jgi:hypothetical protein